ncbi:MAG: nitrogenase [Bacteroidales bacterium]|nr:nitrogenase [Bacteroidales bacterium]
MDTKDIHLDIQSKSFTATRNACKVCTPLGASIVFKGIEGCLPMLHGSQGCATYIRRYLISHFKEPMDIASSNFSESSTVFGGNKNFIIGINNIISQYNPKVIAIASTCLSETIGEDVPAMIREYIAVNKDKTLPEFIYASTPSYQGTHMEGFHEAVYASVKFLAQGGEKNEKINIFPGFVSTEDLRHVKEIFEDFGLSYNMLPDYSDSLDNPAWEEVVKIPAGGTSIEDIKSTGTAKASIELGRVMNKGGLNGRIKNNNKVITAGKYLKDTYDIDNYSLGLPIGIKETDEFFAVLSQLSGKPIPKKYQMQRGRLVDAYIDAHKHIFGQRAIVFGDEDMVIGLTAFLYEIGVVPVLVATGGESGVLKQTLENDLNINTSGMIIRQGMDFEEIAALGKELNPDFLIGNSKGYYIARELKKPLVRVGFPIHDRYGCQRIQHLCYEGTQQLFDTITNAIVQYKQDNSEVGYKYI